MFDIRWITLFCFEKHLSKHKITIFSKKFGRHGHFAPPLATPMNGYHPALVQLCSWHNGMHFSWETKQREAAVVGSFTLVSIFVYGDDQFLNLSVPFQDAMPLATQPPGVLSSPNSLSNFSKFDLSLDLAAASASLLLHSFLWKLSSVQN